MYGGDVVLSFTEKAHKYKIAYGGKEFSPPSVTTITALLDKSTPLMYWSASQATEYVKQKLLVDGSTWELKQIETLLNEAKVKFREVKTEAADVGTEAHGHLEYYQREILGAGGNLSDFRQRVNESSEKVKNAVEAGVKWLGEHWVKPLAIEEPIYSLQYNYAGRFDKTAEVDGKLCLVDWKTSKEVYEEFILQMSAYWAAWTEEKEYQFDAGKPERNYRPLEGAYLVRLGKDDGEFEAHFVGVEELGEAFEGFKNLLGVYNWRKQRRERLKREKKEAKDAVSD